MPKPIVFIAALLLALPAFAQTRMPARQVEADTNMVNIAISLPFTVQAALDWIDANWPALSSESWSNLDPAEDTVQSVFDWVDDNWQAELDDSGWLFLDPESPTTQSVFNWIDTYMGIDTNGWGYLAPTASTAQATFTWLDERFSGFDPDAVVMPGSNIVGGTLVNNQWTGMMPGTNIAGFSFTNRTWYPPPPPYTNIYLRVGTNQGLTVVSNIAYLDYVLGDTPGTAPATGTLLLDLKLGSAYTPPRNGLAASQFAAPGYGVLADWIGVTTASARTNGIVRRSATGFTVESNGTYYASCDFYYAYPGPAYPVGARLVYVTNGVSTTLQESIGNTGSKTFHLASTSFVAGATGVVRVEFSTPDGGHLFFSSFKFGVVE